jgi:hypothetical protein
MAPGNEEINMPMSMGAQAVPLAIHIGIKMMRGVNGIEATSSIL